MNVYEERLKELDANIAKVEDELSKAQNKYDDAINEKKKYIEKIIKFSNFDLIDIIPVLCDLCNVFESSEKYKWSHTPICYYEIMDYSHVAFRLKENMGRFQFFEKSEKNGYSFVLPLVSKYPSYKYKTESAAFCPIYVKDFISYVVSYRIENDLETMDIDTLKKLEQLFLIEKKDELEKIFNERSEGEQRIVDENVLKRKQILDGIMKK